MIIKMKRKINYIIVPVILLFFMIFWFIPFTNVSHNVEGKFQYCRYRFAVYEFHYIESEGEGENLSDTYIGKIKFEKKIGGILEYLGLKQIENHLP